MIDVLMPFRGDVLLLREAVDSVIRQDGPDWRLTIVEDAHHDDSVQQWIAGLAHPQIVYVRNSQRLGVSGNLRRCLELATADYVVFMGCDDVMLPGYVSSMEAAVRQFPDAALFHPRVRVIDEHGATARPLVDRVKECVTPRVDGPTPLRGERLAVGLLHGNWCYFPAICWRRDRIATQSFRTDMETVLDLDLLLHLVLHGEEIVLLPAETFEYRRHSSSASSRTARDAARFEEGGRLFREVARECRSRGWTSAERAARLHVTSRIHAALLLPNALRARDRVAARRLAKHVVGRTR